MFNLTRIICPFALFCFQSPLTSNNCPTSCQCYNGVQDSISLVCGNIEDSSLSDLTSPISTLAFANITFNDRVIYGSGLKYVNFEHLIFEGCGGASQVTNNRPDRLSLSNETLPDLPSGHSTLTITNSRHIFEWKWSDFRFRLVHIESSSLFAFHSPILTKKFVTKVIGEDVTSLSLISCRISSISPGALSDLVRLKTLRITQNGLTRLDRSMLPNRLDYLWLIDLSFNQLESVDENLFNSMTRLKEINLSGNKIINLDESLFNPVWSQLTYLNIKGNRLRCKQLCWSLDSLKWPHPYPFDEVNCNFNGTEIQLFETDSDRLSCYLNGLLELASP